MNSKIFNSILFDELKPWLITFDDDRILKDIVFKVCKIDLESFIDIEQRLKILLKPFQNLYSPISIPYPNDFNKLSYSIALPKPNSLIERYYSAIIDTEILRYYNETLSNPYITNLAIDVPFQIGLKTLKGIAIFSNKISNDIKDLNINTNGSISNGLTHFVLNYLLNNLIPLYFSIQDHFKDHLIHIFDSIDDFNLYYLGDNSLKIELNKIDLQEKFLPKEKSKAKSNLISFGFKGDVDQLTSILKILVQRFYFLDESKTSIEQFVEVFKSKDLKSSKTKIYLSCATNEFQLIMEHLQIFAKKFTPSTISKSRLFHSNEGTLIDANLLYVTKHKSKLSEEKLNAIKSIFQNFTPIKG